MMKSMDAGIGRVLQGARAREARSRHARHLHQRQRRRTLLLQLAVLVSEDVSCTKAARACRRSSAGPASIPAGRVTEQAAITMDWTATILAVTGTTRRSGVSARWREPDAGLHRRAVRLRSHAVLAHGRRARRRASVDGNTSRTRTASISSIWRSIRARKTTAAASQPARFERIKQQYLAWNARMLPRPTTSLQ